MREGQEEGMSNGEICTRGVEEGLGGDSGKYMRMRMIKLPAHNRRMVGVIKDCEMVMMMTATVVYC